MDTLEHLNQSLSSDQRRPGLARLAHPGRDVHRQPADPAGAGGARRTLAVGRPAAARLVLKTLTGIGVALFISYLCGALWRPSAWAMPSSHLATSLPQQPHHHHRRAAAVRPAGRAGPRRWRGRPVARLPGRALPAGHRRRPAAPLAAALVMPVWRRVGTVTAACQARQAAGPIARGWIRAWGPERSGTVRAVLRPARNPPRLHAPAAAGGGAKRRAITRWHGTTMPIGFAPLAAPTRAPPRAGRCARRAGHVEMAARRNAAQRRPYLTLEHGATSTASMASITVEIRCQAAARGRRRRRKATASLPYCRPSLCMRLS